MDQYNYPLNPDWSVDEIIHVVDFLTLIEEANESGANIENLTNGYKDFKSVVTSISEEKQIDKQFQAASGYSIYRTMKSLKELTQNEKSKLKVLKMR